LRIRRIYTNFRTKRKKLKANELGCKNSYYLLNKNQKEKKNKLSDIKFFKYIPS